MFRAAADIADAMRKYIGNDFCAYSDGKIRKELERCRDITYVVEERHNRVMHIGLASSPASKRAFKLRKNALYG